MSLNFVKTIPILILISHLATGCGWADDRSKKGNDPATSQPPDGLEHYEAGRELFKTDCSACHGMPGMQIEGTNIFDGLFDRLPATPGLYCKRFILDGKFLWQQGDPYLHKMQDVYSVSSIHDYRSKLTDREADQIVLFLKVINRTHKRSRVSE